MKRNGTFEKEDKAKVQQCRATETRIGESLIRVIFHTERTLNLYFYLKAAKHCNNMLKLWLAIRIKFEFSEG